MDAATELELASYVLMLIGAGCIGYALHLLLSGRDRRK